MAKQSSTQRDTSNGTPLERLEVRGLSKVFRRAGGEEVDAVSNVDLTVRSREIIALLGPSGCGKSTLLRCVAGLDEPNSGSVHINGKVAFDSATGFVAPPNKRDVSMMFQSYALWPHMSLEDNVAYPLVTRGVGKAAARRRANEYLELVGLHRLGGQYPGTISGGQQQRAALARTLISDPSVVLFDEPLSNVDAKVRVQLRRELLRLHAELGFAAIYVTHDQDEAMGIGDKIAVMRDGHVEQLDTPVVVYERPRSLYTAEFVGAANIILGATFRGVDGTKAIFDTPIGAVVGDADGVWPGGEQAPPTNSAVTLMARPEYCQLLPGSDRTGPNHWSATLTRTIYAGSRTEFYCAAGDHHFSAWKVGAPDDLDHADEATFHIPSSALRVVELHRPDGPE